MSLAEVDMCTRTEGSTRREMLRAMSTAAAGFALGSIPLGWAAAEDKKPQKVLFFTKSAGFQHPCITRKDDDLSFAEQVFVDLGKKHGLEVMATKDGTIFTPEGLAPYDALMFYTTGNLTQPGTDKTPPMPANGKDVLLKAIADGKGFVGSHCCSDTFHSSGANVDPFIRMVGGEFVAHGKQQKAKIRVATKDFPSTKGLSDFELFEEWYAHKNYAPDMHIILVQETAGMEGDMYMQAPYPETWARMHGKGRVFYTSMGHREDVWTNKSFQQILLGGLAWALKNVDAQTPPNFKDVAPEAMKNLAAV
jgi:type 1 glutamine amidotransferase